MPLEQDNHSAETASRPTQSRFRSSLLALGLAGSLGVTALATAGCQQRDPVTAMGKSFENGGKETSIKEETARMGASVSAEKKQDCATLATQLTEIEKGARVDVEGNPVEGDPKTTVGGLGNEQELAVKRAEMAKLCMKIAGGKVTAAPSVQPSTTPSSTPKTDPVPSSTADGRPFPNEK